MVTKVFDMTKVLLLTVVFEVFTDGLAGYKIHPNANSEALGCPHATLLTIATEEEGSARGSRELRWECMTDLHGLTPVIVSGDRRCDLREGRCARDVKEGEKLACRGSIMSSRACQVLASLHRREREPSLSPDEVTFSAFASHNMKQEWQKQKAQGTHPT